MWIFVALVAVPILEIALFIEVGGAIGLWPTIGIVIATALAGAALLRAQGLAAIGELQARLDRGDDPTPTLAHGALILVAGVVLLTPGFFTDAVGFMLLIPPVRSVVIRRMAKRVIVMAAQSARRHPGRTARASPNGAATVEGSFREVDEPDNPPADHGDPQDPPRASVVPPPREP
ncbi:MAG: FxsA family protein [Pikeienuella sp.]